MIKTFDRGARNFQILPPKKNPTMAFIVNGCAIEQERVLVSRKTRASP
jgi:hypothetical protein